MADGDDWAWKEGQSKKDEHLSYMSKKIKGREGFMMEQIVNSVKIYTLQCKFQDKI